LEKKSTFVKSAREDRKVGISRRGQFVGIIFVIQRRFVNTIDISIDGTMIIETWSCTDMKVMNILSRISDEEVNNT
jgi:hypothetical protein